jgi:hypothetical protein
METVWRGFTSFHKVCLHYFFGGLTHVISCVKL